MSFLATGPAAHPTDADAVGEDISESKSAAARVTLAGPHKEFPKEHQYNELLSL
jgi:hypothetical protein